MIAWQTILARGVVVRVRGLARIQCVSRSTAGEVVVEMRNLPLAPWDDRGTGVTMSGRAGRQSSDLRKQPWRMGTPSSQPRRGLKPEVSGYCPGPIACQQQAGGPHPTPSSCPGWQSSNSLWPTSVGSEDPVQWTVVETTVLATVLRSDYRV